ncbi:MAG: AAA family ATPase [Candidatus Falkowbacteria bacterium]|nr:AAA family ATPase [Candidatus Falkowbacteria bacterium]
MLITRIKASNFYGVKDTVEVSFIEGGEKEKIGYVNAGKERVSLISGFYGANASGKSTILNLIDTIIRVMFTRQQDFVIAPNGIKQDIVLALPNYHISMQLKPIEMEMDFIIDEDKYCYSFSITNEGKEISREILFKNNKKVFTRENHNISFEASIKRKIASLAENIVAPKKSSFLSILLDDSSDISVFGNLKEEIGVSGLKKIKTEVCFITDKRSVQMGQNNISGLMAFAINYLNSDSKIAGEKINAVNSVVKYFEPSFEKLNIEKIGDNYSNSNPTNGSFSIKYDAKYNNFYKELGVMELSAGTRELISYISEVLRIIKVGGIVVYDETSKYYHPDMEIALLNLFKDKDINKNNAQIFFSSHNHETFDILQNDQAHILEKKDDNIIVSKVSDYDVKERDNIKRIYRFGSLGGVPDTIDFNRIINNLL